MATSGKKKARMQLEFKAKNSVKVSNKKDQNQKKICDFYSKHNKGRHLSSGDGGSYGWTASTSSGDGGSYGWTASTSSGSTSTSSSMKNLRSEVSIPKKSKYKTLQPNLHTAIHSDEDQSQRTSQTFPERASEQRSSKIAQDVCESKTRILDSTASFHDIIKDKGSQVTADEGCSKHKKNVHEISDSESDCSTDTATDRESVVTQKKPLVDRFMPSARETPKRQQSSSLPQSAWSARDTEAYRNGYPNKKDNMSINDNWKFYNNEIESRPRGTFIDNMHKHWFGDYSLLEEHHGYIQWLFPIREMGMNWQSRELQPHEAKMICSVPKARKRVLKSYEMMLHFWGMRLEDRTTGKIARGDNWKERFKNLNRSSHNYLRITRMLKSLGELGHEHFKLPFLEFILREAITEKTLANAERSCLHYWIHTLRNEEERKQIQEYADNLIQRG